ncbi:MAG: esterase/lipase family protein [Chloroflexaceae bacterium]
MSQKPALQDMVIVIPGIMGSVLQKDGKDLWAPSRQALSKALFHLNQVLDDLRIDHDPGDDDLGDGIRATRLVQSIHGLFGLHLIDGYDQLIGMITQNFEVVAGAVDDPRPANFYPFPYDWRRNNAVNARKLQRLVETGLKRWRNHSGAQDAKVIILAHSMGGLVARYYLEVLGGWQDCRALFTYGTPHRGSVNALDVLCNGWKKYRLDLSEVVRSLPAAYQLLPMYEMIQVEGNYAGVTTINTLPNLPRQKIDPAVAFHRAIKQAVEANEQDERYREDYRIIPIVGTRQRTNQSATFANGHLSVARTPPTWLEAALADGDGTVPRISAIPAELKDDYRETFVSEQHSWLHSNPAMLENLRSRLETIRAPDIPSVLGLQLPVVPAEQPAIDLAFDELYGPDDPITIHAELRYAREDPGTLEAGITPVGADTWSTYAFVSDSRGWTLTLEKLPPDMYYLRVQTRPFIPYAPPPVHGVFEVVG